jgi:hypothetical protein
MSKKYEGMYLGIVVQNDDPKRMGRVKVFVPHVTPNVYENWYAKKDNKKFNFVGRNLDSDLTDIIEPLKEILPWANSIQPSVGSSGSGRYNAYTNVGSISDTNKSTLFAPQSGHTVTEDSLNVDHIGEKPGKKYEYKKYRLQDAFSSYNNNVNKVNRNSKEYIPSTYSNCAKGSFGIPNVGSHVWCFFHTGDPLMPVYFGVSLGQEDWKGIYDVNDSKGIDYPGSYENLSKADTKKPDYSSFTYRNKYVFNQKAGSLEFINTDNREVLKLTHYSGSFKEYSNDTTTELAASNNQILVLDDQYYTINGYSNSYVGRDLDNIIKGDHFKKIGSHNKEYMDEWKRIIQPIMDLKQLFEIRRTDLNRGTLPPKTSSQQRKSGTPAKCPVCNTSYTTTRYKGDTMFDIPIVQKGRDDVHAYAKVNSLGGGVMTNPITLGTLLETGCPACGSTGISPSSMDGNWQLETEKDSIKQLLPVVIEELAAVESKMGLGGSEIIDIAKDKVETIGLAMNDFSSIRVDVAGKFYNNAMTIQTGGTVPTRKETPLLEYVHVDDLPGGSYTLNICNKYNVQVGAGGIKMRSYGPVEIGGTIVNVGGSQVNIGSENEVNIDGGKRLSLVSDILTLRQRKGEQVLVDSNLGVNGNVVIGGGLHVEGELSCHHITAPVEIQETELTRLYAKLLSGLTFRAKISGQGTPHGALRNGGVHSIKLVADSNDNKVLCYDHSHHFKNVPLNLKQGNDELRDSAKVNMSTDLVQAKPAEMVVAEKKVK